MEERGGRSSALAGRMGAVVEECQLRVSVTRFASCPPCYASLASSVVLPRIFLLSGLLWLSPSLLPSHYQPSSSFLSSTILLSLPGSNKRKVECCLGADAGILGWTEEKEQVIDGKRGPISRGKLSYWGSKSGGGEGKETKACPQPAGSQGKDSSSRQRAFEDRNRLVSDSEAASSASNH
eukprot:1840550-Rhodomonas_salina.1